MWRKTPLGKGSRRICGAFHRLTSGAHERVSIFGMTPALCAVVLGLTPFAGAAASAFATIATVAVLLPVEFMIPLDPGVLPTPFRRVTCAGAERTARRGFDFRSFPRPKIIALLPDANRSDWKRTGGLLNPFSSWPVRRALHHPDFSVVLEG